LNPSDGSRKVSSSPDGISSFGDQIRFEGSLRYLIGYLKSYLRKWFFKEPWFEKLFVEAKMVLYRTIF